MSGVNQVTQGAIPTMTAAVGRQEMNFDPVLQIFGIKAIGTPAPGSTAGLRYRVSLTDGRDRTIGIISSGLANLIQDSSIVENSIVRLKQFTVNQNQGTAMIVVIELDVVALHAPPLLVVGDAPQQQQPQQQQQQQQQYQQPQFQQQNQQQQPPQAMSASSAYGSHGAPAPVQKPTMRNDSNANVIPIKALNPYANKWTIKARITAKTEKRSWNNAKGSGTLFSIDLLDSEGSEIRGTFFKDACEKFYPILEQEKVYIFSGGKLKPVGNPAYSQIKNGYEITFDAGSTISPVEDEGEISKQNFQFVKIADISDESMVGKIIDVIAYVRSHEEPKQLTSNKEGGKQYDKRDIVVCDESGTEVRVTLWGEKATSDPGWANKPIVAFKGVKVGDFGGRTLSLTSSGSFQLNPMIPEGTSLYQHFANMEGGIEGFKAQSLSSSGGGAGRDTFDSLEKRKTVTDIKEGNLGAGEKPDYFTFKGSVTFMKHDTDPWYTSCPNDGCKKKVQEDMGQWRCEKCNQHFPDCTRRYMLSASLSDHSGTQWFSFFDDTARTLLGVTAHELYLVKEEHGEQAYNKVFQDALFKPVMVKVRAKQEPMPDGGDMRLRCGVTNFAEVDFVSESRQLIDAIARYGDK